MHSAVAEIIKSEVANVCTQTHASIADGVQAAKEAVIAGIVEFVLKNPDQIEQVTSVSIDDVERDIAWAFLDAINNHAATGGKTYVKASRANAA